MNILILGADQVGANLAQFLSRENHQITVIDDNPRLLETVQAQFGHIRTVLGAPAQPHVLARAGGAEAEMLIAVTHSEEINILACQVAWTLFHTPTKIARVRADSYAHEPRLFGEHLLNVDYLISPEVLVTADIQRLIGAPGALEIVEFAEGKLCLANVRAHYGGWLVGKTLRDIPKRTPDKDWRIVVMYRRGRPFIPAGDTMIEAEDELFCLCSRADLSDIMKALRREDKPLKKILIAGGGNIGCRLAASLEAKHDIKLIENHPARADQVADQLKNSLVLIGDSRNEQLLHQANIGDMDLFCAVTNDDEANILSAMLARRLGARKVVSLVNRMAYIDMIQSSGLDVLISPHQTMLSALLRYIRSGDVVQVQQLRRGSIEAIEAVVHDGLDSPFIGKPIEAIKLPPGALIGALVRNEQVLMAHHDTIIENDDHVLILVTNRKYLSDVGRLFQK